MKTLTIALTLCFSALFASQAEAGPYRKSTEYPARLVAVEGWYCYYEMQTPYGVKLGRAVSQDGCYREMWSNFYGGWSNLRLPYADYIAYSAKVIETNQRQPVSNRPAPRPTGPAGSGVIAVANIGKNNQSAPKNRQVKANYEANDAARLAAEAINGY